MGADFGVAPIAVSGDVDLLYEWACDDEVCGRRVPDE